VAERADVSIGSLYQYCADKQAIFQALQRRHRAEARTVECLRTQIETPVSGN
jgi:AcrR family transcriptional regulator